MKRVLHGVNILFCVLLAALSVLQVAYGWNSAQAPSSFFAIWGGAQFVWALLMLVIGALLPEEARFVSPNVQAVLKIVLVLAALGGEDTGNPAAFGLANGELKVQRFWEPALPLAWLFMEAVPLVFFPASGILGAAMVSSAVLLALLYICSLGWKILECKAQNIFRWSVVLLPSLIIAGLFGVIFLITWVQELRRGPALNEQLADARAQIAEALDSYDEGTNPQPGEGLEMADILALVRADLETDAYYRWVAGEKDTCSLVVWCDTDEEVYVYRFTKAEDLYYLETAFASDAIARADVEGKQEGVIPYRQEADDPAA